MLRRYLGQVAGVSFAASEHTGLSSRNHSMIIATNSTLFAPSHGSRPTRSARLVRSAFVALISDAIACRNTHHPPFECSLARSRRRSHDPDLNRFLAIASARGAARAAAYFQYVGTPAIGLHHDRGKRCRDRSPSN